MDSDPWENPRERRRDREYVTHHELRVALQPLFNQKARVEPALRFFDAMRLLGLEELLPMMLKEQRVHEVLRQVGDTNWKRLRNWGIAIAAIYGSVTTVGSLVGIGHVLRWW